MKSYEERVWEMQEADRKRRLNLDPKIKKQITKKSLKKVNIGRIYIDYLSGKKAERAVVSL